MKQERACVDSASSLAANERTYFAFVTAYKNVTANTDPISDKVTLALVAMSLLNNESVATKDSSMAMSIK